MQDIETTQDIEAFNQFLSEVTEAPNTKDNLIIPLKHPDGRWYELRTYANEDKKKIIQSPYYYFYVE